ncbi:MAG: APC family permease [Clostridiales Family XIII bacterium]|jgi:amino acid transporter|nr:APC family permease [Clostridiales Family XIII bacterium]
MPDPEETEVAAGGAKAKLKKHNIRTSTAVFMVFSLVAAGAYGIESMIPESGPGLTLVILMVLPFIWGLPFGLVTSELGSVRPQEGGYYKWVQEALGEFWGFQAGWWRTVSIYIDNTLYVILAAGYISAQWDIGPAAEFALKAAMILIFMYINLRGIKDVGAITNILSVFVIIAFAMIAVIGFLNWRQNPFVPFTPEPAETSVDWIFYIGAGISVGMWMYSGYESMSTIAGELENPQVIPKATLITVPLIVATYIFPTMGGLASMGLWEEWGEGADAVGYADVAATYLGYGAGAFFIIVAVIAQCSIYNTYIASGSRGFFALAEDNLAPPVLVKVDKKYGVPYAAVISIAAVNLILCNFAFKTVVIVDVFLLVASYILVYISCVILRRRIPEKEYKFRIPGGYGFLRLLCVAPICVALVSFMINGTDFFIGGMAGIISGPVMYVVWRKMYGGLSRKNPAAYPQNPLTGLGEGDVRHMSVMFLILGAIGVAGRVFLQWYESGWAYDYYPEEYKTGFLSDWDAMLASILIVAILCFALAAACFLISGKVEKIAVRTVQR